MVGQDGPLWHRRPVRRELDRAIRVDEYVEWDEAATYVCGVNRSLELLADLICDGHPDQVIELTEHAIDLLEQAVGRVQDDGDTHGCLVWTQKIHVRACAANVPDPTALAQRLFTRATADEWGTFANVVADYADVLGPTGLPRCVASSPRSYSGCPGWSPGRTLMCAIPGFWSWPSGPPRPPDGSNKRWSGRGEGWRSYRGV